MLINSKQRLLDYLAYLISQLSLIFLLANIFGVYWVKSTEEFIKISADEGYPFNYFNWQVTVQAFLCLSCILLVLSFSLERFVGIEQGGYTLKSTIAGIWFCSMLCTIVALSFYTRFMRKVVGGWGMSYRFGWASACLTGVASGIYAFV